MAKSRREFLVQSGIFGAVTLTSLGPVLAKSPSRRAGIQLYTVYEAMRADAAGTLKKLHQMGYQEVETAGFGSLSAKQFRALLDDAGVTCPSAHLQFDPANLGPAFEDAHALGAQYAVSSMMHALVADPKAPKTDVFKTGMSLDEAKRTAELANRIGEGARRAGLQYAYHNHNFEFAAQGGGAFGYDMLLEETDPQLVKFEIDCGWMIFAGHDPVEYIKKYPGRFPMLHIKDFLHPEGKPEMLGAELGHGSVDYKPIFAAAEKAGLQHYFVEQEGPFPRMKPLEAAQVDYDYLHSIGKG